MHIAVGTEVPSTSIHVNNNSVSTESKFSDPLCASGDENMRFVAITRHCAISRPLGHIPASAGAIADRPQSAPGGSGKNNAVADKIASAHDGVSERGSQTVNRVSRLSRLVANFIFGISTSYNSHSHESYGTVPRTPQQVPASAGAIADRPKSAPGGPVVHGPTAGQQISALDGHVSTHPTHTVRDLYGLYTELGTLPRTSPHIPADTGALAHLSASAPDGPVVSSDVTGSDSTLGLHTGKRTYTTGNQLQHHIIPSANKHIGHNTSDILCQNKENNFEITSNVCNILPSTRPFTHSTASFRTAHFELDKHEMSHDVDREVSDCGSSIDGDLHGSTYVTGTPASGTPSTGTLTNWADRNSMSGGWNGEPTDTGPGHRQAISHADTPVTNTHTVNINNKHNNVSKNVQRSPRR